MKGRCFHGLCCFWLRFSVILSMAYRLLDPSTPSPSASHPVDYMWRSHWSLVVIEHNSFVSWYFGFWSLSLSLEINNTHIQLIDAWNPIWKFQNIFLNEYHPFVCGYVFLRNMYMHWIWLSGFICFQLRITHQMIFLALCDIIQLNVY